MNDLRCYFCGQPVVPGEVHQAEDCRSVLKEQLEELREQHQLLLDRVALNEPQC